MFKNTVTLTPSIDRIKNLRDQIERLDRVHVYVGVPEDKSARRDKSINNAQLVFIHTNGSPRRNIPPRPIIEPAIAANKELIAEELKLAGQAMLSGHPSVAVTHYKRAGQLGQNYARGWFVDPRNQWPKLADSTIAERQRKGRPAPYTPLIDTGQMRRSIVYVFYEGEL